MDQKMKNILEVAALPIIFWIIAVVLWQSKGSLFYLFNFGYIGTAIGIGNGLFTFLPKQRRPIGRKITQLLVGLYMLVFLGLAKSENMQLEGFFFYVLMGMFAAAALHYAVAKIVGPLVFNRGWCGWACWTTMVLDFLPYAKSPGRVARPWEWVRAIHFAGSLILVMVLWFGFNYRPHHGPTELAWLLVGNGFYFLVGIVLAYALKDNRAFCKYVCPITVPLKIGARFSLLRITGDAQKCNDCGVCTRNCPMDIQIPRYIKNGQRVLSSECIFCQNCIAVCPNQALTYSFAFDVGGKEYLRRRSDR